MSKGKAGFNHKELHLSEQEFKVLWCLCEYRERFPNIHCPFKAIANKLFEKEEYMPNIHKNIIFPLVHKLREKIEPDLKYPEYIVLVRNKGYKLEVDCKFLPD